MDVLSLLESKNRCLRRFLELSADFLRRAEQGDLSELDPFQTRRETVLRTLDLFDRKITEVVAHLSPEQRTSQLVRQVELALAEKDDTVRQILIVDDKIIRRIEEEKTRIVRELASSEKSRSNIQRFKSTWVPTHGEELDQQL
jgi:hypothetical protein